MTQIATSLILSLATVYKAWKKLTHDEVLLSGMRLHDLWTDP
jgi:hypothetical protein